MICKVLSRRLACLQLHPVSLLPSHCFKLSLPSDCLPHDCTAVPQDAAGNVTFSVLLMDLDEANCTSTVEAAILAAIEDAAGTNTTTSVSFKPYRCGPCSEWPASQHHAAKTCTSCLL